MLSAAQPLATRTTYTDELAELGPSQMELTVSWSGQQRSFTICELSLSEIAVVGFRVDDLDLCDHEASIEFCDGEVLDEANCRVVFGGFDGAGVARLRLIVNDHERQDLARLLQTLFAWSRAALAARG